MFSEAKTDVVRNVPHLVECTTFRTDISAVKSTNMH